MTEKKLKIMTFSHYGQLYGANRSLLTLLISSSDRIEWRVICRKEGDFTKELERLGINFSVIEFKSDVYTPPLAQPMLRGIYKLLYNIAIALYLAILVRKRRVDFIHTNSSVIFIGSLVALISRRKHLWHIREFVYEDYNLKYSLGRSAFNFFARQSACLICISKSILEKRVVEPGLRVKHRIIYNGLVDEHKTQPKVRQLSKTPVISIVGVINPAKNQLAALKAINKLIKKRVPVKLKIIGDIGSAEYYKILTDYIDHENINEYIEFTGFLKETSTIFEETDISLMCSSNEAFGRVTVESMMHGIPVVAFGSYGTTEIIENGKNGLLYFGDESTSAEQIAALLDNPELYNTMSKNAIEHVREHFSIKSYVENFADEVSRNL